MPLRSPITALLAFVVLAAGVAAQTTSAPVGPVQPPALTALNNAFRVAYADAKRRVLASSGPTLIVSGDNFALLRDGRRLEANVGTPIYDPVKTIAHIPLAIYVSSRRATEPSTTIASRPSRACANSSRPPRPASIP